VPGRLAAYILDRSMSQENADTITLDISKGQLAAIMGTIPETLSRSFNKLVQEDLITLDSNQIQICDRVGLRQRAGRF
jgi:CRP-like cAMP-binding protein